MAEKVKKGSMKGKQPTGGSGEAAEILLRELEKGKKSANGENKSTPSAPKLEQVSGLSEEQMKAMDESELEERSRAVQERLEKREVELKKQAEMLDKMKKELKAIEAPMKKEILEIRTSLEEINRNESRCVTAVNDLRKALFEAEKELGQYRDQKAEMSENLIRVMAEYEKRKMERLDKIADIVGDEQEAARRKNAPVKFGGF
mmetsp:Transcript_5313/g.15872  ORF Transcript_5313/g.15872 Transcript_5313/m.15872 type:complete len:203 (+) Transcript_5313:72-680(+)